MTKAYNKYKEKITLAQERYDATISPAVIEYEKEIQPAKDKLQRVITEAKAEWVRDRDAAMDEYGHPVAMEYVNWGEYDRPERITQ